jgi:hypothetical protein
MTITSGFTERWANSTEHGFIIFTGNTAQSYNLPDAKTVSGATLTMKLQGTGAVTVRAGLSSLGAQQTIDGATTSTIGSQFGILRVLSDGTNWNII